MPNNNKVSWAFDTKY